MNMSLGVHKFTIIFLFFFHACSLNAEPIEGYLVEIEAEAYIKSKK